MQPAIARVRPRVRTSLVSRIHLWLGLTVGAVLAMCGLTGSYLAFYPEIEQLAIAELRSSPGAQPGSYESVYRKLAQVSSGSRGEWNIELPEDGGVITGRIPGKGGSRMVSLDPVSLDVVRDVTWGGTVSTWIYELHYHLLMGRAGKTVMGVIGLACLVMLGVGATLWWRSGRSWRSRLAIQVKGTSQRKIYDTHRLLGLGSLLLLFLSVAAAVAMSLPQQVRPILASFSPISRQAKPTSTPARGQARISVDDALAIARATLPHARIRWVRVPAKPEGSYAIRYWHAGDLSRRFPKSYIWLDQYSGRVLGIDDGSRDSASDHILAWLYPLHSGQAFGTVGRSFVALLGFVPAILFVTGLLRWRSKSACLKAHQRRS